MKPENVNKVIKNSTADNVFSNLAAEAKNNSELDILNRLNKLTALNQKSTVNGENSHDYKLYYKLIQSGIMQQHINLKSANWIYADIQKMSEQNYLNLKSSDDRKKKIRRYFQSFGVNKFQTETERLNAVSELKADLLALLMLKVKKENK